MSDEKLFPKQVKHICPSFVCRGAERVFARVDHVVVRQPVFDSMDRVGPATRLPFAGKEPTPFGACTQCGTVLFIGPAFEELEADVEARNEAVKRKLQEEEAEKIRRSIAGGWGAERRGRGMH
ncbi:MAG: hypothetical protein Q8O97_03565 [bacterium]|nr:hypothetical protein [bacterium]